MILKGKYHLGLTKTGLNSEVVLILGGLNSDINVSITKIRRLFSTLMSH